MVDHLSRQSKIDAILEQHTCPPLFTLRQGKKGQPFPVVASAFPLISLLKYMGGATATPENISCPQPALSMTSAIFCARCQNPTRRPVLRCASARDNSPSLPVRSGGSRRFPSGWRPGRDWADRVAIGR